MLSFFVDTTVCGFSLYQIFAYFLIYSCLGWCLEVIYAAVTTGKLINRGFLNGPVCPIYGFGMVIVLFALTPLSHNLLLLYLGGVILPSALELVGGWALYKLYHTRWWDYSDYPFNIGGYICLEFSLLWGVGTLIVMKLVHPIIADAVAFIPPLVGLILMFLLYVLYAADTIATAFAASDLARDLDALENVADSMHAFCRAAAGRAVSCSSCSAQPRISASGVRTSWLTPAIQLVRASSRRAMISLRRRSCSLVRLTVSASSPAKPSVGSRIVPPSATVASPAAIVCKRRAPRQLNSRQHAAATPSSSASAGSIPAAMALISCSLLQILYFQTEPRGTAATNRP